MSEEKTNNTNEEKEDYGPDIMTLVDEDGTEREFEVIDNLVTDNNEYFALVPTETPENIDSDDGELVILKVVEDDGEERVILINDVPNTYSDIKGKSYYKKDNIQEHYLR